MSMVNVFPLKANTYNAQISQYCLFGGFLSLCYHTVISTDIGPCSNGLGPLGCQCSQRKREEGRGITMVLQDFHVRLQVK